jgi:hypothetical protein
MVRLIVLLESLLCKFHPPEDVRREAGLAPNSLGRWFCREQVEKCLLKKTDAPRLLQTCQATSTDGSWVKAQQFCMLATDFL